MKTDISIILSHFQQTDPLLFSAGQKLDLKLYEPNLDSSTYFHRLTQDIISQQLSIKVAEVIGKRFVALLKKDVVQPEDVLNTNPEELRAIGISWSKIKYLTDLAEKSHQGLINYSQLPALSDEAVIDTLVQVKGIGRWTAEMFLIFTLGRPNIFSKGDLGLKRGIEKIYRIAEADLPQHIDLMIEKWTPYQSYASQILWKSLAVK